MGACGRAVNLVESGAASGYTKTEKEYSNFSEACILWTVLQTGLQIIIESNFLMFCIFPVLKTVLSRAICILLIN